MKTYRVTIKHRQGEQTNLISTTVPAANERQAIEKIIAAHGIDQVVSRKAELLTSK